MIKKEEKINMEVEINVSIKCIDELKDALKVLEEVEKEYSINCTLIKVKVN